LNICILLLSLHISKQILKFITMSRGTVKFFNDTKGFGFIVEEDSNKEHFVHISGLIDEVREGDEVEFELTEGRKGLNAVNVKVI
jgi:CspA family cold shock protein